ncbi:chorismate mutase [Bacillus piscicola]|uniref:chorismate mutase n=1 Tax=Bacillus piscicola TaxID=1632684 RepID=UPI001F089B41|nr:chorismate mutase [Bacillus piscicola]
MIRGVRGATTISEDREEEIVSATTELLAEMIEANSLEAESVSNIWFTVTADIKAAFPAKATRQFQGWEYVPVMCAQEIPVPGSLPLCIRVMLTADIAGAQSEVKHIYLRKATRLRPDLSQTK